MHTNLWILIEISVEIGMTQKTGIYWSCIMNCEFQYRNFTKIDRIFLKLQWKLSENCQFAVFRLFLQRTLATSIMGANLNYAPT